MSLDIHFLHALCRSTYMTNVSFALLHFPMYQLPKQSRLGRMARVIPKTFRPRRPKAPRQAGHGGIGIAHRMGADADVDFRLFLALARVPPVRLSRRAGARVLAIALLRERPGSAFSRPRFGAKARAFPLGRRWRNAPPSPLPAASGVRNNARLSTGYGGRGSERSRGLSENTQQLSSVKPYDML